MRASAVAQDHVTTVFVPLRSGPGSDLRMRDPNGPMAAVIAKSETGTTATVIILVTTELEATGRRLSALRE